MQKTKDIKLELINHGDWETGLANNTDPYGACCYKYAEAWGKLMQWEMEQGKNLQECAERTSFELGWFGITGAMYGCIIAILSHCWKYGDELRIWHNKQYGHKGNGIVNPAILTLKISK